MAGLGDSNRSKLYLRDQHVCPLTDSPTPAMRRSEVGQPDYLLPTTPVAFDSGNSELIRSLINRS